MINGILKYGILSQVGGSTPPAPSFPTSGLTGYWTFDNTYDDSTDNNDGTGYSSISYVTGKNNNGIKFGSSTAYVEVLNDGYGYFNVQSYTINAWVYRDIEDSLVIWSYDTTSHSAPYYAQHARIGDDGDVFIGTNSDGTYRYLISNYDSVPLDEWAMITVMNNRNNLSMYINGTKITSFRASNTDPDNDITYYNNDTNIGRSLNSVSFNSNGQSIDEVAFWDRELTSTEVTALYNSGDGLFYTN